MFRRVRSGLLFQNQTLGFMTQQLYSPKPFLSLTAPKGYMAYIHYNLRMIFSERQHTFTFAIMLYRPSVCRLYVCNVRAPYSAG